MDGIFEFFQTIVDFLDTGIWDFAESAFAQFVTWAMVAKLKFQIYLVQFSWGVAHNILVNLGLSSLITSAWSSLDSTTVAYLTFFRLPECINLIMQAFVTRFVLNFMGV